MENTNKRKRKSKRRKRQEKRIAILAAFVVVCALIVIVSVQLVLRSYIGKVDNHRIIQGVSVASTDVSGLSAKEAKDKVETAISSEVNDSLTIQLEDGRSAKVELNALGIHAKDLDKVIQNALDYGKKGNVVKNYKILKKAKRNKNEKQFPVFYAVREKEAKIALDNALASILNVPENARISRVDGNVTMIEEKAGETLDIKKTVQVINKFLGTKWKGKGGAIKASVVYEQPKVKTADLQEMTDLLGSFTTFYGSDGTGRSLNVESGANHLNGSVLKPGEEISANAAMEPYTEENGYAMADSYAGDTVVQSMGGGICQVSTTLYNALLFAELEITERSPHSMLVSYAEPSKDAAIADDVMDLKFKNNYNTPIYIEAILADGNLTFNIYGKDTREAGRTVEFVSEKTKEEMPTGKRFVATEDSVGDYYVKTNAQAAISAQLWKVVYVNGEEQSRDIINYSQYVPAPETIAVGTASDNQQAVDAVVNAIHSQSEDVIMEAIREATGG